MMNLFLWGVDAPSQSFYYYVRVRLREACLAFLAAGMLAGCVAGEFETPRKILVALASAWVLVSYWRIQHLNDLEREAQVAAPPIPENEFDELSAQMLSEPADHPDTLDVWDSLMVRACKSNRGSEYRLRSVMARRANMSVEHINPRIAADHLLSIVQRFHLRSMQDFVWDLNTTEFWRHGRVKGCSVDPNGVPYSHSGKVLTLAASIIRCTAVKKLPGLRSPSRFERLNQEASGS